MSEEDRTHDHAACRELLKNLSDYVDGELDQALCVEIERHMLDCDDCRVVVDTLRNTVLLYGCLPSEPLPAAVEHRLFDRLELSDYIEAG